MRFFFPANGWRRKVPAIGAFLIASCLLSSISSARVFRLLGPAKTPEVNDGRHGWETAYKTTMTVNGRPTEVRLYSARHSEPVVEQLAARFQELGAKVSVSRTPDGASGVAVWPDQKEARFLVLSPKSEPRHLFFVFYPEPGTSPEAAPFPVPKYAGGTVQYTVSNDKTGTFFSSISSMADSSELHTFYATEMAADGWELTMPALVSDGGVSGMAVYQKGKKVCYVQAVNRPGRANMLTLLVKSGKL